MAKKDRGWIKLYRQITDSYIWSSSDPFDRRSAWIDLLLMANHETRSFMLKNGREQVIESGQLFTSLDHLAIRWHWSRNKVRRYLALISAQGMCTVTGTPMDKPTDKQTDKRTDKRTDNEQECITRMYITRM